MGLDSSISDWDGILLWGCKQICLGFFVTRVRVRECFAYFSLISFSEVEQLYRRPSTERLILEEFGFSTGQFETETFSGVRLGNLERFFIGIRRFQTSGLPVATDWKSDSYDSILVLVDRLREMVHYLPVQVIIEAPGLADIISDVVVKKTAFPT